MTDLPIPEKALKSHTGILGMTGSGKTTTAKLVVEHVVAEGARVCILDPIKSDWWGLTSSRSGKTDGLPFQILGGPHGHVPLHSGAGKAIGELVARGSLPLSIIDMADFEAGGLQAFFCDFAAMLMKRMKGVLYLVIEEAHEFAPKERAGIGKENLAIHFAKKLAIAGRTKGIRLIVATQRTQALHNAILGSCETMVVHRFIAPADQGPVLGWLKGNVKDRELRDSIEDSLSGLADGEAWVVSGVAKVLERVQFPRPWTYDNTKTPDSDDAEHQVHTAAVDIEGLREAIGEAVAEAEANDPKKLRAELAERDRKIAILERQQSQAQPIMETDVDAAYKNGYDTGYEHGYSNGVSYGSVQFKKLRDAAQSAIGSAAILLGKVHDLEREIHESTYPELPEWTDPPVRLPAERGASGAGDLPRSRTPAPPQWPRQPAGKLVREALEQMASKYDPLSQGERKILEALIQFPAGRTRSQLMVLTGYAQRSIGTYLPLLVKRSYVESVAGLLRATNIGRAAVPDAKPLPQGRALQDHWRGILPEGERRILEVLLEARGGPVTRTKLQAATNYAPRSLGTYLPKLAAKGLVINGRGEVWASEELF